MRAQTRPIDGVAIPAFLYGTAWKEDGTERLTTLALRAGFRGIDTANQRRNYHEAGVGAAIATDRPGPTGKRGGRWKRFMTAAGRGGWGSATFLSNNSPRCVPAPRFVQNRCCADRGWDRKVRALCTAKGVVYQGFSLLILLRSFHTGQNL